MNNINSDIANAESALRSSEQTFGESFSQDQSAIYAVQAQAQALIAIAKCLQALLTTVTSVVSTYEDPAIRVRH